MTTEQAALSLYQLLGAPLYALIQAETYAANATADFIERVGFEPTKNEKGSSELPREDMGQLRTISFQQERRTSDGQAATYKVEVPLLSILPIPALQVKEAELEFFVKIVDTVSQKQTNSEDQASSKKKSREKKPAETVSTNESSRVPVPSHHLDMKAMLGRGQPNAPLAPNSAFDMQVHIKIKVAQADPPAGLSRLFNLMEQSISSTRLEAK
jgi:hypothetical protein